jgi:hypothetical protein
MHANVSAAQAAGANRRRRCHGLEKARPCKPMGNFMTVSVASGSVMFKGSCLGCQQVSPPKRVGKCRWSVGGRNLQVEWKQRIKIRWGLPKGVRRHAEFRQARSGAVISCKGILIAITCGAAAGAFSLPSLAQSDITSGVVVAPDYGSGAAAGAMSNGNFNTPESDGRPGVKFFTLGVQAFRKGEYRYAIDMYKVAASWAYKPAEYNLAVMYFKGQGVPVDRPLGAAWMVLAAERGELRYVQARDMMVTLLSKPEFKQTDEHWGALKNTYGDAVALRRAKAQWAWVKTHQTGTRVGGTTGELAVGVLDGGHTPVSLNTAGNPVKTATTAAASLQGGAIDGSIAYRQFQQSDDPYDPVFLKNRRGTVKVEPLTPLKPDRDKQPAKKQGNDQIPAPAHPRSA